jgi:hypothetical protein
MKNAIANGRQTYGAFCSNMLTLIEKVRCTIGNIFQFISQRHCQSLHDVNEKPQLELLAVLPIALPVAK